MKLETLKIIYDRYLGGASYTDTAQAIGKTPPYVSNVYSYFKNGTYDEVVDVLVFQNYKRYSLDEYIEIAEQMVTQKIKLIEGVLHFHIEFNRLAALTRLRKNKGSVLSYEDMRALSWTGKANVSNSTKAKKSKADEVDLPNVTETPHGTHIMSNDMTAEELEKVTDKPRKFGRANVHPHAYHGKKVMRNKSVTEANKQQERIKQSIANAQEKLLTKNDDTTAASQEVVTKVIQETGTTITNDNGELSVSEVSHRSYNKPTIFTGHPASKFLDENGNYTGGGRGRPPYIDVNSEGFDTLPLDVQIASFRRFREDKKLQEAFLKKVQVLAKC